MADLRGPDGVVPRRSENVTVVVTDRYAGPIVRNRHTGVPMRGVDVAVLAIAGANPDMRAQPQPALNVGSDGFPVRVGYPDDVLAVVAMAAGAGPAKAAQQTYDDSGRADGAVYVVNADLVRRYHDGGAMGSAPHRFDVVMDPASITPAESTLVLPADVLGAQRRAVIELGYSRTAPVRPATTDIEWEMS